MTASSQTTSADWDPLGAAPGAWDLPDLNSAPTTVLNPPPPPPPPMPVVQQRPRHRSHVGGVTFGLAFMAAAVLAIVSPHTAWLTIGHIAGIVAGILGLGMVIGAFTRGGRGLVVPTILASIAAFVLSGPVDLSSSGRFGDLDATPTTTVDKHYGVGAGNANLDLTRAKLSTDTPITTDVSVVTGNATVTVPANADVEVTCVSTFGNVKCLGENEGGVNSTKHVTSPATTGKSDGKINLTVSVKAGDVKVKRG